MLRRTTRNKTRNEENADRIRQRKKDLGTAQQLNDAVLLRDKDVNKHRSLHVESEDSLKRDEKSDNNNSSNNTQKSKIKVYKEETECSAPETPKSASGAAATPITRTQTPPGSVTPAKRILLAEEEQSLSPKRFESYHSEEEEGLNDNMEEGLVVLPPVELDLSILNTVDDEAQASPKKKNILDTLEHKSKNETDTLDETSLPSEVEYAGPHEEELPSEPRVKVDLSGFSGALPNIGAYEIKELDPYDLDFGDDDVERIIRGRCAAGDEEKDNQNDEVFVLPTEPFSPSLEPKEDEQFEIPFSDYLFDVDGTKVGVDAASPTSTPH